MNQTDFTIDHDLSKELGADFASLLNNLDHDQNLGLLKSQLQILQSSGVVQEALPSQKHAKAERELNYKATKTDALKWIPQLRRNAETEQLLFGQISANLKQTSSSLAEHFKPRNDFESEMQRAISACGVTEDRVIESKALPAAPNIQQQRTNSHLARLKSLLFSEQRKNRRLSKIKSKMWRKVNRKSELLERERLLKRLEDDNPDIAAKIREEMEEKRARLRMLKGQSARRKWAQLAMRYGGKDVQKVISREAQNERDELDALTNIVKRAPMVESDDDSDIDFNPENEEGSRSDILKRARDLVHEEIGSDDSDSEKDRRPKGLMGLKFMQLARDKEKQTNREEAQEMLSEIDSLKEKERKEVCMLDERPSMNEKMQREKFKPTRLSENRKQEPSTSLAVSNLVASMGSTGVLDEALQQEALIQEAFVTGDQTSEAQKEILELMVEDENKKVEGEQPRLAGWGSWTGDGLRVKKSVKPNNKTTEKTSKPTVYVNTKLDRKLAPYFVKTLPFAFSNKEQFEAVSAHPLGPEWNTSQAHKRFIQPEVAVRAGTVIMPLEFARHLPKEQADSFLDMWSEKGRRKAPKARL